MKKGFFYQLVLCVATLLNSWPDSSGITGRDRVESLAGMKWNHWPRSRGMRGRDRLEFAPIGQVVLMTVHKSKGLEFHSMIFYGLDNQTWWSLTPQQPEELNSFFVAFTRAQQRAFFTLCINRGQPVAWLERFLRPAGLHRVNGHTLIT